MDNRFKRLSYACRHLDYAALQWLIHQADLRGDVGRADAYRAALIRKEA